MKNHVDRFFEKLKNKKVIAVIIVIGIAIVSISKFWEAVDYIYYKFFSEANLTDQQLKEETLELARDIAEYVVDRRKNEPEIDYNDWEGSTDRYLSYSRETMDLYYVRFGSDVAMLREEFLIRGIKDEEFERLYAHPTNTIGLQMLSLRLAAMAARL